jgi:pimeloyl-ACP methyl ester carboxylesterase
LLEDLVTTWDDDWSHYIGDSFMDFNPNMKIPPLASDEELSRLIMPVLLIGAENDISFPGEALIARLQGKVFNLQTELLKGAKHSPPTTPEFREWLYESVIKNTVQNIA